jgi:fructoselysine 6-kinase
MDTILLGPVSRDIYLPDGPVLPGGGCLNMALHWRRAGRPFLFLTRVGAADSGAIIHFLQQHRIEHFAASVRAPGRTASIDITIRPDNQPWMENFQAGVWETFQLLPAEEAVLRGSKKMHTVLVDGMIRELIRLGERGILEKVQVSADFLDFRHMDGRRFKQLLKHIDLAFIGWPGEIDAPQLAEIGEIAAGQKKIIVVTLGSRGVKIFNRSATPAFLPIEPVPVQGTTLGCGDTYIAHFLHAYWNTGRLRDGHLAGRAAGREATHWQYALPEEAYDKNYF